MKTLTRLMMLAELAKLTAENPSYIEEASCWFEDTSTRDKSTNIEPHSREALQERSFSSFYSA